MNCKGNFVFKGVEKKDGGTFTDDKGKDVKYDACYLLKVDEIIDGKANDRRFRIALDNKNIVETLKNVSLYTAITITFDVVIYATRVRLIPSVIEVVGEKK